MAGKPCAVDECRTYSFLNKRRYGKAELLSLAERDALFVIQRRTWSKENLVTYVRLYYPGRFYQMRTIL